MSTGRQQEGFKVQLESDPQLIAGIEAVPTIPVLPVRRWSTGLIEPGIRFTQNAAFVAIAKAPADRINAWAKERGWSQIALVSGSDSPY